VSYASLAELQILLICDGESPTKSEIYFWVLPSSQRSLIMLSREPLWWLRNASLWFSAADLNTHIGKPLCVAT
ncbi:hypothetical protein, partial [Magnetococcus sp. PR-3]|uniref:hypothetical protein n=1 Tax=Magnetococcus sp. PR-3 TaxID=3120355 RepID=UPI002FCE43CB